MNDAKNPLRRPLDRAGRSPVHALNGMASTSHVSATQTAIDVLKAGGNALDASIAACAMQCVVEPESTGIGGDCFALYAPSGGDQMVAYNGSGRAPAAATPDAFKQLGIDSIERGSAHSVVIPGAVDAWCQLHKDHGKMPFAELLQPAIQTAREGYGLTQRIQFDIAAQAEFISQFPITAGIFLENGAVPAVGSVRTLAALADSLEHIAKEGRDAFYQGRLANDMINELQSRGGLHTLDDFKNAKGEYVTPIHTDYRGHRIHQCPPNGQGIIALLMMNILAEMPIDANGPLTAERMHWEIEICRITYALRDAWVADPNHVNIDYDTLLTKEFAQNLLSKIDPKKACERPTDFPQPKHKDTVYITVVDKDRNACSFINTLFYSFGSGITTESGITLTNRGMSFSLNPEHPNVIAPGKRPMHTIIPGMVTKAGKVTHSFGVMGGHYQAMGQQQFLSRHLDFHCDVQYAQDLPRFMINLDTHAVDVESGVDESINEALRGMGHNMITTVTPIGGSQAIQIDWESGVLTGGSDPRKDGCALGY